MSAWKSKRADVEHLLASLKRHGGKVAVASCTIQWLCEDWLAHDAYMDGQAERIRGLRETIFNLTGSESEANQ